MMLEALADPSALVGGSEVESGCLNRHGWRKFGDFRLQWCFRLPMVLFAADLYRYTASITIFCYK